MVCLLALSCAQGASPVAPSAAPAGTGGARTERKVGDPGGTLVCDSLNPCTAIAGTARFAAPSVEFIAGTTGQMDAGDPAWFTARTLFAVQPVGRLEDSSISVVLSVTAELAHLTVFLLPPGQSEIRIAGAAPPQFSSVADASCASGQRLETQFTVNLEKFGKTSVTHTHCR